MKRKYHVQRNRDKKMTAILFHYVLIKSGYMKSLYHNLKEAIKAHNK